MATSLRQNAYRAIRRRLIRGQLPPGTRLSESGLSKELGISRSPIREAISRLISEGLLEETPGAGAIVKAPDRADLLDLFQFREWIEGEAAAEAAAHIGGQQLAAMERACAEMREVARVHRRSGARFASAELIDRFTTIDMAYHLALLRACGNRRAMRLMSDYRLLVRLWHLIPMKYDLRDLALLWRQHGRVLRAVRRGDGEASRQLIRRFIRESRDNLLGLHDWKERQDALAEEAEAMEFEWKDSAQRRQDTEPAGLARVSGGLTE